MGARLAADYLGIGTTKLVESGPPPKKWGGRVLWDRKDLDRFADALSGQPLDEGEAQAHGRDVEHDWFEQREKRKQGKG